ALSAVALIAQPTHQLGPGPGDASRGPSSVVRWAGEAVAGERGDNELEGISRVAAVSLGIGQRADDAQELGDRARPAMGENEWQGIWLGRADVQKMDVLPVDRGNELRILIKPGFPEAPVIAGAPVLGQLLQIA